MITSRNIMSGHPMGMMASTDIDYAKIASHILLKFNTLKNELLGPEIKRYLALKLTLYYEDVVSDFGIWRSFTDWNKSHYGKYVPFYEYDADSYFQDQPEMADIMLILWFFISQVDIGVTSPYEPFIAELAQLAYDVMDENFETVPVNEELKSYLADTKFADDFIEQRDVLKWQYFGCYLTHTPKGDNAYYNAKKTWSEVFGEGNGPYFAECMTAYSQNIGPLALHAQQWAAMLLRANQRDQEADIIENQEFRECTLYKIEKINPDDIILRAPSNEKITVTRYNLNYPMQSELEKGFAICSLVKYNDEWQLNGFFTALSNEKAFNGFVEEEKQKKTTLNYNHIMELSGGSPLFYFKDRKEFTDFATTEMKMSQEMTAKFFEKDNQKGDELKDLTLFIEKEKGPQSVAIGIARCIKDERNPFYNQEYAQEHAVSDMLKMPDKLCRYIIAHNLLPDASFNTHNEYGIDGNKLMQDNLEFVVRALREIDY